MENKKDYRLFISLLFWNLIPFIYSAIRMYLISISGTDINILGQLEWFDLGNEILTTALITPLYFLLKKDYSNAGQNGMAFVISFVVYSLFSLIIYFFVGSISTFMQAEYAATYLHLQIVGMVLSFSTTFCVMLMTLYNESYLFYGLLIIKIILFIIFDFIIIPVNSDYGSSYSDIIVNLFVSGLVIIVCVKKRLICFNFKKDFLFLKEWMKIGLFSGIQIFLDNFVYMVIVCRMVNMVSESGNYWIANNFIYGLLLVPIFQFAEVIKKNHLNELNFKNTWRWYLIIFAALTTTIPIWHSLIIFITGSNSKTVLFITYLMMIFYLFSSISTLIDSFFVSKGKTRFLAFNSFIVNVCYYGIMYVLFLNNVFELNLGFIICLFGFGMIVHLIISVIQYIYYIKRQD